MGLFSLKHSQTLHIILARFLVVVNRLQPIQPLGRLNHELHLSFVPGLAGGKRKKKKKKKKKKKEEKRVHEKSKIRFDKFILSIMSLGTKKFTKKFTYSVS